MIEEFTSIDKKTSSFELEKIIRSLKEEQLNIMRLASSLENVCTGYKKCERDILRKTDLYGLKLKKLKTGMVDLNNITKIMEVFDEGWKK